jgi:hypothetical protein
LVRLAIDRQKKRLATMAGALVLTAFEEFGRVV